VDFALRPPAYKMVAMISRGAKDLDAPAVASVDDVDMRILAIDYGRKRIGLALSDGMGITARPLAVLTRTNRRNDFRRLRELCREHAVSRIVVGHPLLMTGTAGEMASEAARFAARLEKVLGLPTELIDERLTSWEAKISLAEAKSSRRRGESVDDLAAAILLREYLEKKQSHGRAIPARKA
jgi:putative holliday junction resolvase